MVTDAAIVVVFGFPWSTAFVLMSGFNGFGIPIVLVLKFVVVVVDVVAVG